MACSRGKASPSQQTTLRLFSSSAGYCQRPCCARSIFVDTPTKKIHIAEMAHIIAAADDGPRADSALDVAARGAFENLIILCPACHTIIDKAPEDHPVELIRDWKTKHHGVVASALGVKELPSRRELGLLVRQLLARTKAVFDLYGPEGEDSFNPESDLPDQWRRKVATEILPTNRRLIEILERNTRLLKDSERQTVELYRQHVLDFEMKHLAGGLASGGSRFPSAMTHLFESDIQ